MKLFLQRTLSSCLFLQGDTAGFLQPVVYLYIHSYRVQYVFVVCSQSIYPREYLLDKYWPQVMEPINLKLECFSLPVTAL